MTDDALMRLLSDLRTAAGHTPLQTPVGKSEGVEKYSVEAFPEALRNLLGDRSGRWLAAELDMHWTYIYRLLKGERSIVDVNDPAKSLRRIEDIARELRVHPSYFAEWRRLWVMATLDALFEGRPDLSIRVWKAMRDAEQA